MPTKRTFIGDMVAERDDVESQRRVRVAATIRREPEAECPCCGTRFTRRDSRLMCDDCRAAHAIRHW
jgi:Zn finger protein HypA/HybF involved in hydrogenase expression